MGRPGGPRYPNYQAHADDLIRAANNIIAAVAVRSRQQGGVDPRLLLVITRNAPIDPEALARAGIRILDDTDERTLLGFTDDLALTRFKERVGEFRVGPSGDHKRPPYAAFFDAIDDARAYAGDDKLTSRLREALRTPDAARMLLDVECWHPDDPAAAAEWQNEVRARIVGSGDEVLDAYISDRSLLSLLRVRLAADALLPIAELSAVARVDLLPDPQLSTHDVFSAEVTDLPRVPAPAADAPLVGVVDSGLRDAHPLLAPAVRDVVVRTPAISDGRDRAGHGTGVASLILHGSLEPLIGTAVAPAPPCWLLSVRVLDDANHFPEGLLWEKLLEDAVEYCADRGARIVNLSVGSALTPYRGAHPTPVAALLDEIARRRNLVLVVSVGNAYTAEYIPAPDAKTPAEYAILLAQSDETRLIDPAPSALALTVGAIRGEVRLGPANPRNAHQQPLGEPGWPSSITRRGPGARRSVKPELVAPGGTHAYDHAAGAIVAPPELKVVLATVRPDRLLGVDLGTSYAAPLVTHVAAGVAERYPTADANLVRALTLQSAQPTDFVNSLTGTQGKREELARGLLGYGVPRAEEARSSTAHRVVMYGSASITVNDVQLWPIPVPASFMRAPASRELVVSLAFDPPTRGRRLDYLASTMYFDVVRGLTPQQIDRIYRAATEDELEEAPTPVEDTEGDAEIPTSIANLGRRRLPLEPNPTGRHGANQVARWSFRRRLLPVEDTYYLVVRNVASWAEEGSQQGYAIAVAWVEDPNQPDIYLQLEARLRVPIRIELET